MACLPLIAYTDGKYVLNQEAADWVGTLEAPFSVLCCAGKFRTGKSFLLNRLTKTRPGGGFGVGDTVQACTRGIWISKNLVGNVLVCDTEGIDALDADSEHDVFIFAMALLMSSIFLYNSQSHLDEAAVQTLALMTKIADRVQGGQNPSFYWVLRDFALQLTDDMGRPISHAEYLENTLRSTVSGKCATREAIKQVFRERYLVTLPRPGKGESAQKLESKAGSSMNPKFEKFLDTFREHILDHAQPVSANGVAMSGKVYVSFLSNILSQLNEKGAIPKIQDTYGLLLKAQSVELEREYRSYVFSRLDACPVDTCENVAEWIRQLGANFTFPSGLLDDASRSDLVSLVEGEALDLCHQSRRIKTDLDILREDLDAAVERLPDGLGGVRDARNGITDVAVLALCRAFEKGTCEGRRIQREEDAVELATMNATQESLRDSNEAYLEQLRTRDLEETSKVVLCDASCQTVEEIPDSHEKGADDAGGVVRLEMEREDHLRQIRELKAEEAANADHLRQAKQEFAASTQRIQATAVEKIKALKEERDAALLQRDQQGYQQEALRSELDKTRFLLKEAQEKTIHFHQSTLEELKRRDEESRVFTRDYNKDYMSLRARYESISSENRGIKRELEEAAMERKQIRQQLHESTTNKVRHQTTSEYLHELVQDMRNQAETLRRENAEMRAKILVLEASGALQDACHRLG